MLDALLFTKTSPLLSALYPDCLWKVKEESKVIYLTFDDGPIPEITPWVLDCLQEHQAKATFFCIGKNVEAHPDIFKRIVDEGHAVGNHTFDHLNGWKTNNEAYFDNIAQCDATLAKHGVASGALFRPPYGKLTPAQYLQLKKIYKIIMWDVLSFDFDLSVTQEKVLDNVLQHTEPGSIIVMHDSLKAMDKVRYALPKLFTHFTPLGFQFKTL